MDGTPTGLEQDLCPTDDLLRGEAPQVAQVAENGLRVKGKINGGLSRRP